MEYKMNRTDMLDILIDTIKESHSIGKTNEVVKGIEIYYKTTNHVPEFISNRHLILLDDVLKNRLVPAINNSDTKEYLVKNCKSAKNKILKLKELKQSTK